MPTLLSYLSCYDECRINARQEKDSIKMINVSLRYNDDNFAYIENRFNMCTFFSVRVLICLISKYKVVKRICLEMMFRMLRSDVRSRVKVV